MNNNIWFFANSALLSGVLSIILCVIVLVQNKKRNIDRSFCLLTFFLALWSLGFCFIIISTDKNIASIWARVLMLGMVFVPSSFLFFIISFLEQVEKAKKLIIFSYISSFILSIFIFTPYFIVDLVPRLQFKYWPLPGIAFHLNMIFLHGSFIYSFYLIFKNYKFLSENNLNQVKYIILGFIIAFSGGNINHLLFYNIPIEPYGFIFVSIYILLFGYAVIKYNLLDITIVIKRSTIFTGVYFAIFTVPIIFAIYNESVLVKILGEKWWIGVFIAGGVLSYLAQMVYNYVRQKAEGKFLKEQRIYNSYLRYASNDMIRFRDSKRLYSRVANVLANDIRINHVRLFVYDREKDLYELVETRGVERRKQTKRAFNSEHPFVKILKKTQENILYDNLVKIDDISHIDIQTVKEEMRALGAAVILPNLGQGSLLGFITLSRKKGHSVYTKDDINVLTTLANQVALAMENAYLYQNLEHKIEERTYELNNALNIIQNDLKVAKGIQEKFLTREFKDIKKLFFYLKYYPMSEIGGDIYDITKLNNNHIRIFLADATGHGVQAALATMLIKSEYDKLKRNINEPSSLLETLNNDFYSSYNMLLIFFTCIVVDIHFDKNKIVYSSAGHPDQYIIKENEIIPLPKTGRIIGIVEDNKYDSYDFNYDLTDRILLFTDGIIEEINNKEEEFGEDRLLEVLGQNLINEIDEIVDDILEKLKKFKGVKDKLNSHDDIAILGVKFNEVLN